VSCFFGLIANLAISVIFWSASIGAHQYQTNLSIFFWALMLLMQAMAVVILLMKVWKLPKSFWHKKNSAYFSNH